VNVVRARRIVSSHKRGSSWPVVAETEDGRFLVKLRGAAQGTAALVAEVIVAELADAPGLAVRRRALLHLDTASRTRIAIRNWATCCGRARAWTWAFASWTARERSGRRRRRPRPTTWPAPCSGSTRS